MTLSADKRRLKLLNLLNPIGSMKQLKQCHPQMYSQYGMAHGYGTMRDTIVQNVFSMLTATRLNVLMERTSIVQIAAHTWTKGAKMIITPARFEDEMKRINETADGEVERHKKADALMCATLVSLGYATGVKVFHKMEKWYD